jgi:hypothetical protein
MFADVDVVGTDFYPHNRTDNNTFCLSDTCTFFFTNRGTEFFSYGAAVSFTRSFTIFMADYKPISLAFLCPLCLTVT